MPKLSVAQSSQPDTYNYKLRWSGGSDHTYHILLNTSPEKGKHTDFRMPAWRPGRYIDQDFAAGVIRLTAEDDKGKPLPVQKTDRSTWRVQNPDNGNITLRYDVYANTQDAGSSYVDDKMAYFNGATLFLYVPNRMGTRCTLSVPDLPKGWRAATALPASTKNLYIARDYHELIDCPTIFSPNLKSFSFSHNNRLYWLHFETKRSMDEEFVGPFRENVRKIVAEQMAVFGNDAPFKEYHFIYWLVPFQIHHAVEHANSAMFCKPETVAETPQSLGELNGITSHEFWHVWNVKAIRPAALTPYDYNTTPYTQLHWFTEGVTDYYTNLMLARAGIISTERLLGMYADGWARLDNSTGPNYVSPARSSHDSWLATSRYTPDFMRTSYYPLGSRAGVLLDFHIRNISKHKHSLDDVFVYLYKNYGLKGKGVPEDGIELACKAVTGKDFTDFFAQYIYGTAPVDYAAILKPMGLTLEAARKDDKKKGPDKLGIGNLQTIQEGYQYVIDVNRGSAAAKAGLVQGDIIMMLDGKSPLEYKWDKLAVGQQVEVMLHRPEKPKLIKIRYDKDSLPVSYTLVSDGKKSNWMADWLKSQGKL